MGHRWHFDDRVPTGRGIEPLSNVPDGECRDGGPELLIRCEQFVIPVPMPARWRDQTHEPVEELTRRERDDAVGTRPHGFSWAARTNLVGSLVPWEHVADFGDAVFWTVDHGESLGDPPRD